MSESKNVNPKERAFILARLNTKFGMLLLDNKKKKPANEHMAEALSILKPFRNVRLNVGHKYQMAETYNDYAYLKHDEKKYKEAEPYWEFSLKLRHSLSKIYPQRYLRDYSASLSNLGSTYYFTDRYDLAIDYCSRAISVTRELAEINPTVYLPELAQKLNNLGAMYREKMDRKMAVSTLKEALTIREKLAREEPMIYLPKVAYTLINLSVVYQKIPCNKQISLNYLDKAVSIIKKFKRKAAINKYFDNIEKILLAWQIDPKKYFRDQSSIFLNDRS